MLKVYFKPITLKMDEKRLPLHFSMHLANLHTSCLGAEISKTSRKNRYAFTLYQEALVVSDKVSDKKDEFKNYIAKVLRPSR